MKFFADLHIHSRFSIATAKTIDFENLYIWAQLKGITVVGTGDVTHPGWFAEIVEKLVPAEPGLFKLNDTASRIADARVPFSCRRPVRFLLSSEISNVYKKNGSTRKNHNLVYFPDIYTAASFNKRLAAIGNIASDGRPTLSLDAKHLLEIVLESSDSAFLIPAHIWTPWFSLLGSKSGFDRIEDCFEELTPHIFAVETGLSSDPAMNRRVSTLDKMTLVSNSDAHSPDNLGREANLFNTELSFDGIRSAMETGDPKRFLGTIEFHPEEGKYYLDGHRKCNIHFLPSETKAIDANCPICGKRLTCGVLHRVESLSDTSAETRPQKKNPFIYLVSLKNILSEILKVGANTNTVKKNYNKILTKLGGEISILKELSINAIHQLDIPLLAEAIDRVRQGKIEITPGYDGKFGRVRIFNKQEHQQKKGENWCRMPSHLEPTKQKHKDIIDKTLTKGVLTGINL